MSGLFPNQSNYPENAHQHSEANHDEPEPEWRRVKRLRSRHRPTDGCHSESEDYEEHAEAKHVPTFSHAYLPQPVQLTVKYPPPPNARPEPKVIPP